MRKSMGRSDMGIKVGDTLPDVDLWRLDSSSGRPAKVRSTEVLGSGKVVLFAVPGAFTPGCSNQHLPGFVQRANEVYAKGVDTIACVAVNDAWVMDAWAKAQNVGDDIVMLADGSAEFTQAMGLELDGSGMGLGVRSKRYAAVIDNGVLTQLDIDASGGVQVSSCDAVLERL
jgi:glutaredoxin/glutathione-dependent peroxiredoxin